MNATTESIEAAINEGLVYFWASLHVGGTTAFLGHSWEDGGFSTDEAGNPVSDVRGNAVAKHSTEQINPANAAHVRQAEEWYHG